MTKFSTGLWDENKTIEENAKRFGLNYYYASQLARDNHLSYKRKNGGEVLKIISNNTTKPDKMYVHDGQTFGCEGAD